MENLYHYSSIDTFEKMLLDYDNERCLFLSFWATHHRYMNDPTEFQLGAYAYKRNIKKVEDELRIPSNKRFSNYLFDDLFNFYATVLENSKRPLGESVHKEGGAIQSDSYVISFSENRDCIPMWGIYGDYGKGIALGFNKNKLYCKHKIEQLAGSSLIRCLYCNINDNSVACPEEEYELTKDIYKNVTNPKVIKSFNRVFNYVGQGLHPNTFHNIFIGMIHYIGSRTKNNSYAFENEWRLVISNHATYSIKFRSKNCMENVPYLEVYIPLDALNEIIIGPTRNYIESKQKIERFLIAKNIDPKTIAISQSKAPFR